MNRTPAPAPTPVRFTRPWWSGHLPLPTARAAMLTAALVAVVWFAPVTLPFWLVPAAILAVVAVDAAMAPAPWSVGADRELPAVVALDGRAQLRWRVHNPRARGLRVQLADELAPSLRAARRRTTLVLPPRGTGGHAVELVPSRRGTFEPRRLTVRVHGPLGLGARQADRLLAGRIEVHPSFRSRAAAELRVRRQRVLEEGIRAIRARGAGTQFEALRDYVEGDDVRRVDWAATARTGRAVVRTYRAERNQQVLALLDTGRLSAGLVEEVPRLDHAMDALLALATIATRSGDRTGLLAFGARVRATVPPRSDQGQLRRLSTAMHALEPELAESDYHAAFRHALTHFPRQSTLVLFTELGEEAVQQQLVPAVPLLLRRHALVVAAVRDPELDRLVRHEAGRAGDAYRAAASIRVAEGRQAAAARLRSLGVRVIDTVPGELAGRVADAYLELKALGR
ncbi:MAG TPA: DUF58 domain-containing protein [Egicoccus sp.]|nr:DUF58 domain-containing protein [Egicoccus sp.]HSK24537.1 DUF58 domain-containing protein [Egicoccus sp.]